jgi:hypothetical protein
MASSVVSCASQAQEHILDINGELPEGMGFCISKQSCYVPLDTQGLKPLLDAAKPSTQCDQATGKGMCCTKSSVMVYEIISVLQQAYTTRERA